MKEMLKAHLDESPEDVFVLVEELCKRYNGKPKSIFDETLLPEDTYDIIKRFTHDCVCAECGKAVSQLESDNPVQCLDCGATYHFECAVKPDRRVGQLFQCPHCRH